MISRSSFLAAALLLCAAGPADRKAVHPADALLEREWSEQGMKPAGLCSSSGFLRRASLDLIGRIPTVDELKRFLRKPDRAAKIDELLESPEFPRFWSEVWTSMLNGYEAAFETNRDGLRYWLEKQFRENRPFDRIASDLISAKGLTGRDGPPNFILQNSVEPVIKISRTFLGIRLDCARCHDHPFDTWTQEDYKGMAGFFAPMERQKIAQNNWRVRDNLDRAQGRKPRFLTGAKPVTTQWRVELAYYMSKSKPFARNFANRLWYHFMGKGIVDPPDDFNMKNRASVPALLDYLADEARKSKFDVKAMIRLICTSDAYRRSSRRGEPDKRQERVFAYRVLKPLMPEQIFDSLIVALDATERKKYRLRYLRSFVGRSFGEDFTNSWTYRESVQDLMNRLTFDLKVPKASVTDLYMRILSRKPTSRERALCRGRKAEEVVFALANSNEFFFNH